MPKWIFFLLTVYVCKGPRGILNDILVRPKITSGLSKVIGREEIIVQNLAIERRVGYRNETVFSNGQ